MTTTLIASGFLFDMDGTLVDSTAVVEGVWGEIADRHGLDLDAVLDYSHGRQSRASIDHFLPSVPEAEREALVSWVAAEEEGRLDGVVEVPGAADLMRSLLSRGAPVALVTSAHDALARARMRAAGVPMPPVTVFADDVQASKPDPEGYLLGARLLGLDAAECIAFEDAPAGIAAVEASGATLATVHATPSAGHSDAALALPDFRGVRVEPTDDGRWRLIC